MTLTLPHELTRFRGCPFHEFGLDNITFSVQDPHAGLSIFLAHYKLPGVIEVRFSDVLYHAVMPESYVHMNDEDNWQSDAFFARASSSQLAKHLANYTLLESMLGTLDDVKHFRVIAQNFFIEVVTLAEPTFELTGDI